jgi:hypothetical protein
MTAKQLRLLESIGRFSGHGWIEIKMALGIYFDEDDGPTAERDYQRRNFAMMSIYRALERRGFVEDKNCPCITEKGQKVLTRHGKTGV